MSLMTKAIFIQSSHSEYNDQPGVAYHFPKQQYLTNVRKTLNDWVIFYEGRAGGGRGYYSVQRVLRVEDDPADPSRAYAILDRSSELSFENNVPRLKDTGEPFETGLPISRGKNSSAVRLISDQDFYAILQKGFEAVAHPDRLPRCQPTLDQAGFAEGQAEFLERARPTLLVSRPLRDQSFARQVKFAYAGVCAISGLELRNGGGRPEVEAAHIVPVANDGPDTVRNGLVLSGTVHWRFDRGLISVDDNFEILVASGSLADPSVSRLVPANGKLIAPNRPYWRPHNQYLAWHRTHIFKG